MAFARGFEILALGFAVAGFLVVVLVLALVVVVLGVVSSGVYGLRGALLPVACRVDTIVFWRGCEGDDDGGYDLWRWVSD